MARLTFQRPTATTNAASAVLAGRVATDRRHGRAASVAANEPVVGPGWFESSFDLWQGLEVCEEQPASEAWVELASWPLGTRPTAEVRYAA